MLVQLEPEIGRSRSGSLDLVVTSGKVGKQPSAAAGSGSVSLLGDGSAAGLLGGRLQRSLDRRLQRRVSRSRRS